MWRTDVLGEGWQARDLTLPPDAYGEAVATLVRPVPDGTARRGAALYVQGFVDYFFQPHLATLWRWLGRDFYAVDLRGYGRSIRPGRPPNVVADLAVHAEELDAAVQRDPRRPRRGHRHGPLHRWPDRRDVGRRPRGAAGRPAGRRARAQQPVAGPQPGLVRPRGDHPRGARRSPASRPTWWSGTSASTTASGCTTEGGWDFDQAWKPDEGFDVRARWFSRCAGRTPRSPPAWRSTCRCWCAPRTRRARPTAGTTRSTAPTRCSRSSR